METIDPDLARRVWQRVMSAQHPARQPLAPKGAQQGCAASAKRVQHQPGHPSRGGHR